MHRNVWVGLKEGGRGKATETVETGEDFVEYYWKTRPGVFRWGGCLEGIHSGEERGIGADDGD